jgi:hypothetical protein
MTEVRKVAAVGALVLVVLVLSGCAKQYSLQHDWNRMDFEGMTKVPTQKKV